MNVTIRKQEANRRNAQKSTGPKTVEGKVLSAQNSLTHGLLTRSIAFENDAEESGFAELLQQLWLSFGAAGKLEQLMLEEIAVLYWKLGRAERLLQLELDKSSTEQVQTALVHLAEEYDDFRPLLVLGRDDRPHVPWDVSSVAVKSTQGLYQRSDMNKRYQKNYPTRQFLNVSREGDQKGGEIELHLTNRAQNLMRYATSIRRDLRKAITQLNQITALRQEQTVSAPGKPIVVAAPQTIPGGKAS